MVGTHALLSEGVEFADLGLVVVDEQHRFGVEQRDALRSKGDTPPHVLVMTATPIPRTVAMTVYGDLEISALRELPGGRSPIGTTVVPAGEKPAWLERAWQRIREEVAAGHQAYVVCPRIGDGADGPAADEEAAGTRTSRPMWTAGRPGGRRWRCSTSRPGWPTGRWRGLRVGVLHGRLPAEEKDAVMRGFAAGDVDVLVATTVVEVGVDVPNATVMAVLDADRFGISQLHQLRGRVGRGSAPGLCLLVTDSPADTPARQRLDAVASTLDGFELAELDLEQRREGQVLGEAQSGRSSFKLLSLARDRELITAAREEATALVDADPELADAPRPGRRRRRRWSSRSAPTSWRRPEAHYPVLIAASASRRSRSRPYPRSMISATASSQCQVVDVGHLGERSEVGGVLGTGHVVASQQLQRDQMPARATGIDSCGRTSRTPRLDDLRFDS